VTAASLRADLENAKARNRRLEADLTALRRRLGEVIGRDVLAEIGGAEGPDTASRVSQLEQTLSEAQEALARRTEELEAARQINRELMARLNRES
jgi:chromosome segregation ATPase